MDALILLPAYLYRLAVLGISLYVALHKVKKIPHCRSARRNSYVFVFPVYNEQIIIRETISYYEQFLAHYANISLLFVATDKETQRPTTAEIIGHYCQGSKYAERMKIIHSHNLKGTKATQLNVALDYIRAQSHGSLPILVCFDCDARIALEDWPKALAYIQNHEKALLFSFLPKPQSSRSFLVQSLMLHHQERMLVFEYAAALSDTIFWHYPMGATMLVKPQLWQKIDQFPEPIDDIPLRYQLYLNGLHYSSLPFFTLVQAPPNMTNAFQQIIPIFKGVFSYFALAKKSQLRLTLAHICYGLGWYGIYLAEFYSILILPIALARNSWSLPVIFLIQVIINLVLAQQLSLLNAFKHILGYGLRLAQFLFFLIKVLLFPINLEKYKTERVNSISK
ncbi:MAG: glycosyltransferase [Candidatus Abawacabacteria bacterium]|nr:glycosyltransferase [Candidatus Abawacabacteria bacterium]